MDELMDLEELKQIEAWNRADMRHGRAYATKPSITQMSSMIDSIYTAHKLKQRVDELEKQLAQKHADLCESEARFALQMESLDV